MNGRLDNSNSEAPVSKALIADDQPLSVDGLSSLLKGIDAGIEVHRRLERDDPVERVVGEGQPGRVRAPQLDPILEPRVLDAPRKVPPFGGHGCPSGC